MSRKALCPHCQLDLGQPRTVRFTAEWRRESYRCVEHGLLFGTRQRDYEAEDAGKRKPYGPIAWDD